VDSGTDTVTGRWNLRRRGSRITTELTAISRAPAMLATTSGFTFTDYGIVNTQHMLPIHASIPLPLIVATGKYCFDHRLSVS